MTSRQSQEQSAVQGWEGQCWSTRLSLICTLFSFFFISRPMFSVCRNTGSRGLRKGREKREKRRRRMRKGETVYQKMKVDMEHVAVSL